jgi:tetratricopeptide (TPR) repeat protein
MTSDEELLVHLASIEQMLAELEESRAHSDVKPELLRRFDEAERTFPAGYVVVLAAADCARAGSKYPLPGADLIGLAHDYAARLWPGESIGDDELRAGIEWAASCEEGQLPLLISAGEDAYRASPAIAGGPGSPTPPVPPSTWDWLLAHLPPVRLLEVGGAAQWRDNEQMAEQAWTRAFEIGDERVRTLASVGLGELLETRGDYEAAIEALERADAGTSGSRRQYVLRWHTTSGCCTTAARMSSEPAASISGRSMRTSGKPRPRPRTTWGCCSQNLVM